MFSFKIRQGERERPKKALIELPIVNLQLMRLEIDYLATSLKILSQLLEKIPGWSDEDYNKLKDYQTYYYQKHSEYETILKGETNENSLFSKINELLISLREINEGLSVYLKSNLDDLLKRTRERLIEPLKVIISCFESFEANHKSKITAKFIINFLQGNIEQPNNELKQNLDRGIEQLMNCLSILKKESLQSLTNQEQSSDRLAYLFLDEKQFQEAKESFRQLELLKGLGGFVSLRSSNTFSEESFWDFAWHATLMKPSVTITYLRGKVKDYQLKNELKIKNAETLKERLGIYYLECIRLQRIICMYEDWEEQLNIFLAKIDFKDHSFSKVIQVQFFLSYFKKSYLRKSLERQMIDDIQVRLIKTLTRTEAPKLIQYLQDEKQKMIANINKKQQKLRAPFSMEYLAAATLLLGWQQQGPYQLGWLSSETCSRGLENYSLPILKERLPPGLQNKLNDAVGTAYMLISLSVSSWLGYSYHTVSAISDTLLAQRDMLNTIGNSIDRILPCFENSVLASKLPPSLQDCVMKLKALIRWDEIGIIEKEAFLHWLSGLIVHCGMQMGSPLTPIIYAYSAATAVGAIAAKSAEQIACQLGFSTNAQQLFKTLGHMLGYSYTYQYSFETAANPGQSTSEMPSNQALLLFGFKQYVSEKTLKDRYHELALQNHPDKCKSTDCALTMQQLNVAYQVLRKKLQ